MNKRMILVFLAGWLLAAFVNPRAVLDKVRGA